jgi:peptidoglycan/LPS O-acetylase OafA/YrhL
MVFCRRCGKGIHDSVSVCPHCSWIQSSTVTPLHHIDGEVLWIPIASMIIGIMCGLVLFGNSKWDDDTRLGLGVLSTVGLVLGVVSINQQRTGKGMAITGIVLSTITLLAFIGMSFN